MDTEPLNAACFIWMVVVTCVLYYQTPLHGKKHAGTGRSYCGTHQNHSQSECLRNSQGTHCSPERSCGKDGWTTRKHNSQRCNRTKTTSTRTRPAFFVTKLGNCTIMPFFIFFHRLSIIFFFSNICACFIGRGTVSHNHFKVGNKKKSLLSHARKMCIYFVLYRITQKTFKQYSASDGLSATIGRTKFFSFWCERLEKCIITF